MDDDRRVNELVKECIRQAESCAYTGANLYIWQKRASMWRASFLVVPIIAAGFSTSQLFTDKLATYGKILATFSGLLAGFFPTIFIALNMDMRVMEIARSAAEFTNLRDRFRQAANVSRYSPYDEFKTEFEALMDRMDAIRTSAPPAPDWCFRETQKKMNKGDYTFTVDEQPPNAG
ncbi:MAG: hypothetical protein POH28_07480 [Acidocella sp.]|nr:hypothetical protein [Acidocella sp.]